MVKSKVCNTYGMSKEELIQNYNDPIDPGGYFIINGNERVLVMAEDLAENQVFIESKTKGAAEHLRPSSCLPSDSPVPHRQELIP